MSTFDLQELVANHSDIIELMCKKDIIPAINLSQIDENKRLDVAKTLIAQNVIPDFTLKSLVE